MNLILCKHIWSVQTSIHIVEDNIADKMEVKRNQYLTVTTDKHRHDHWISNKRV
jgi:hypothetical protein